MNLKRSITMTSVSVLAVLASSCSSTSSTTKGKADGGADGGSAGAAITAECPVVVSDKDCDKSLRPIVFVHGTFGSGDNIASVAQLFGSNGYCQDRFVAVEYNSLGGNPLAQLDTLIDDIRMKTGQDQVDLLGHSQGTGHCITYLNDAAHAAKVAHYVNLSGTTAIPDGVHALSLSSQNDLGGKPNHAPGAEKMVTFDDEDHFAVAASKRAFIEMYKYLIGKDPKYTEIQCGDPMVSVEGLSETFADNTLNATGTLEVYELGVSPRDRGTPVMVLTPDSIGHAGPFQLKRLTAYEFKSLDGDGNLIGHMYFAPFKRSNFLARFLTPSKNAVVASTTTGNLKLGPGHSAVVARNLAGAFRSDTGDSLKINGSEVLTADNAGRTTETVGLFMSDQNDNGQSDLGATIPVPFVVVTDVFIDASQPAWTDYEWKGQHVKVPNWPSNEGFIVIMLP